MEKYIDLLDQVRVATPCNARWEEMKGSDKSRFCSECSLNVHNLSAMTRPEAEAFVANANGRVCIRMYRRADGTLITQDCPVGVRALRQRVLRRVRRGAATAITIVAGMVSYGASRAVAQRDMVMGKIVAYHEAPAADTTSHLDTVATQITQPDTLDQEMFIAQGGMMIMGDMAIPEEVETPTINVTPTEVIAPDLVVTPVEPTISELLRAQPLYISEVVEPVHIVEMIDEPGNIIDEPEGEPMDARDVYGPVLPDIR